MTLANSIHAKIGATAPTFLQNGGATGVLLRRINWTLHPLGPPERWPVVLQTIVSVVLGSRQPMFVCWGPELHTLYNDGYAEICGARHPAGLGAPLLDMWDDIRDVIGPLVTRVFAGESIQMDDLALILHKNGAVRQAHLAFSYTPLRDDTGKVQGLFCACTDTTQEVTHTRELAHERARLGQMFEQTPSFIAIMEGPDHIFRLVNPAFLRMIGHRDVIGMEAVAALPEAGLQGYITKLDQVRATGDAIRVDSAKVSFQRVKGGLLEDRYVDFVFQPMHNAAGVVTSIFAEGVDVTDRITALSALQTSEQFLRSVLGASSDCIKVLDLDGRLTYISDRGRLVMELQDEEDIQGKLWSSLWKDAGHEDAIDAIAVANQGSNAAFQGYADTFAGNPRYWDVRVTPMLDEAGHPEWILAVSRDISYLKQIEDEREQLMQELSHRLRNAFGMVQSVIGQTLRNATSLPEARETLSGRVRALADAQDILTRSVAGDMQIDEVVQAALLPYRTGEGRFTISGPDATISGRQGLGLSLALHELCTNATKYGALSGAVGHVAVSWDVQRDGDFAFRWLECGGPSVAPPEKSGFGSVLIEKIVASYFNGSAILDFHQTGVAFHLSGKIVVSAPPAGKRPLVSARATS